MGSLFSIIIRIFIKKSYNNKLILNKKIGIDKVKKKKNNLNILIKNYYHTSSISSKIYEINHLQMDENINLGFKYSNEKHINDKIIQFSTSINHEFMIKLQALLINNKRIAEILSYSVIFYNNDGQYFFIPITTNKDDEIECLLSLNEIKKFNFGLKKLEEKYFLKSLYNYNAIDNIYYFPIILNL
jgi:hypothetical protein